MNRPTFLALGCLFVFCTMSSVALAGALEKFGTEPRYQPLSRQQPSPRELAISRAVLGIRGAAPERRQALIDEYSKRVQTAVEQRRYDEADFYTEILRRSGN